LMKFHQKWNSKFKIQKWKDFGKKIWIERKKEEKKHISILDFYCVTKNMEWWLLFVHLPMDDHHKQKFL
jgi:hypothetical protein